MLGMQGCYPAPIAEQSGSSSQMMKGGDGGEGVTGWRGHHRQGTLQENTLFICTPEIPGGLRHGQPTGWVSAQVVIIWHRGAWQGRPEQEGQQGRCGG